jgi:hypothetical protein
VAARESLACALDSHTQGKGMRRNPDIVLECRSSETTVWIGTGIIRPGAM